jgi:hypothetical protein
MARDRWINTWVSARFPVQLNLSSLAHNWETGKAGESSISQQAPQSSIDTGAAKAAKLGEPGAGSAAERRSTGGFRGRRCRMGAGAANDSPAFPTAIPGVDEKTVPTQVAGLLNDRDNHRLL